MSKQLYRNLGDTLSIYRCVSISYEDRCLSGPLGEIWAVDEGVGTYRAFKVLPSGDEKITTFNSRDLHKWISRLQIPSDPNEQLFWANNPNARYEQVTL